MIAYLEGRLQSSDSDSVTLVTNGIGFRVFVHAGFLGSIPAVGGTIRLYTHLVVRDDALELFGLVSEAERQAFLKLLGVGGVGPRLALAVVGHLGVERFWRAIVQDDTVTLTTVPGIGKKTAQRMIVELRDKADKVDGAAASVAQASSGSVEDAFAALLALGYTSREATEALATVRQEIPDQDTASLIQAALKVLGRLVG